MIEKENQVWYISQRGELLAKAFLLDFHPVQLSSLEEAERLGIDYLAFFQNPEGGVALVGVEVKATEREVNGHWTLPSNQVKRLLYANIPVLIVVVNVKYNTLGFNWIRDALTEEQKATLGKTQTCRISLRSDAPEEREKLRQEISLMNAAS